MNCDEVLENVAYAHTRFAFAVVVDSATALCGSDYTERGELAAQADASR